MKGFAGIKIFKFKFKNSKFIIFLLAGSKLAVALFLNNFKIINKIITSAFNTSGGINAIGFLRGFLIGFRFNNIFNIIILRNLSFTLFFFYFY